MREISLPDNVKPALEWVNGRVLQKVTPERKHGLAQGRFWAALVEIRDDEGSQIFDERGFLEHRSLPGLRFAVSELFLSP